MACAGLTFGGVRVAGHVCELQLIPLTVACCLSHEDLCGFHKLRKAADARDRATFKFHTFLPGGGRGSWREARREVSEHLGTVGVAVSQHSNRPARVSSTLSSLSPMRQNSGQEDGQVPIPSPLGHEHAVMPTTRIHAHAMMMPMPMRA